MEIYLKFWASAYSCGDTSSMRTVVWVIREQPFADVYHSMIHQAAMPGAETVFGECPDVLQILRSDYLRQELAA
jgi:hypothetical protein